MTTAEGGMVLAKDPELLKKIRLMRSHGMTSMTLDRYKGNAYSYDVELLGYNYRMDEIRAAIGIAQLARLASWTEKRRQLTDKYRERLSINCPEVCVPFSEQHETVAHIMPVLLPEKSDRQKIMADLRSDGVLSSIHYPPVHQFSYYRERLPGIRLPMTERYAERQLTIPLYAAMSFDDLEQVVQALVKAVGCVPRTKHGSSNAPGHD